MPDYNLNRRVTKPYIRSAAIRRNDGFVHEGAHHCHIIRRVSEELGIRPVTGDQGFVTSDGRFVDRVEGCQIAIKAGQINQARYPHQSDPELFSEDLWSWPYGTSPWISVHEMLPSNRKPVLVTDGRTQSISQYDTSYWAYTGLAYAVTHWMPLPPLPENRS